MTNIRFDTASNTKENGLFIAQSRYTYNCTAFTINWVIFKCISSQKHPISFCTKIYGCTSSTMTMLPGTKRYKWVNIVYDAFWCDREFYVENLIVDMAFVQNSKGWKQKEMCVCVCVWGHIKPMPVLCPHIPNALKIDVDGDDDHDDQRLIHAIARHCLCISICFHYCKNDDWRVSLPFCHSTVSGRVHLKFCTGNHRTAPLRLLLLLLLPTIVFHVTYHIWIWYTSAHSTQTQAPTELNIIIFCKIIEWIVLVLSCSALYDFVVLCWIGLK